MRVIDGDALRDRLQNLGYDDWNQGATTTWAEAFNECADMVDEQPTIEPERKKGKWIPVMNGRGGHCCNRCNGYAPSYMNGDEHLSDFCPNCGAEMTEGEG